MNLFSDSIQSMEELLRKSKKVKPGATLEKADIDSSCVMLPLKCPHMSAYASIGEYYSSLVQFFPPLRRPARAAGVGDGSLFVPFAVVAPSSGSLAPICFSICRFSNLT
jgi:hypothetical protein